MPLTCCYMLAHVATSIPRRSLRDRCSGAGNQSSVQYTSTWCHRTRAPLCLPVHLSHHLHTRNHSPFVFMFSHLCNVLFLLLSAVSKSPVQYPTINPRVAGCVGTSDLFAASPTTLAPSRVKVPRMGLEAGALKYKTRTFFRCGILIVNVRLVHHRRVELDLVDRAARCAHQRNVSSFSSRSLLWRAVQLFSL